MILISTASELDTSKRPKLELNSSMSSGTVSSTTSQHGDDTPTSRGRIEPVATSSGNWAILNGHMSPQSSSMPQPAAAFGGPKDHGSPSNSSSSVLPGYRESIYGGAQQSLPWREVQRDDGDSPLQPVPRMPNGGERRSSYAERLVNDSLNLTGSAQHAHRTGQSHPPPLLISESTNRSSGSSASGASSSYFTPRTPLEPPPERALRLPSIYTQKSSGGFDSQLPPLRPPSLSPQLAMIGSQLSPTGKYPLSLHYLRPLSLARPGVDKY